MGVPDLKYCCCGCSLETGSLIIGFVHLLGSIFGVLMAVTIMKSGKPITLEFDESNIIIISAHYLAISLFLLAGAGIIIAAILIVGIYQRNEAHLNTWVIITSYSYTMSIALTIMHVIKTLVTGLVSQGCIYILIAAVKSAIGAYFICVVYNLSRKIFSEKYAPLKA